MNYSPTLVKPHRISMTMAPKLFSYSRITVLALSALIVFGIFRYIGSEDEMLIRAESSSPAPDFSNGEVTHRSPGNASQADHNCDGRRIYMYNIPLEFNELIGKDCKKWTFYFWAMCDDLFNDGLGEPMNLSGDPLASRLLQPPGAWYRTDQFSLEVIFHHRMKAYPCLTDDPEQASLFYVPYYHTLDVTRFLFDPDLAQRDYLTERFIAWLTSQRAWQLTGGHRHMFILGRVIWDLTRSPPSTWGSSFLAHTVFSNITSLLIERATNRADTVAIPYPTNFHPASDADLTTWQAIVRGANRTQFVSFAGSSRGRNMTAERMVRGTLFSQCAKSPKCKHLLCTQELCAGKPETIYKLALDSVFCLQPAGDTPTRKGIFDTLLSGCIPVVFHRNQTVDQYLWHLKGDGNDYEVLIDGDAVVNRDYDVMAHLERIPAAKVQRLQENVVQLIPSLLYRNSRLQGPYSRRDAFDIAIDSALIRFRRENRRHSSAG